MKQCEFLVTTTKGQVLAGIVTLDGNVVSQTAQPGYELTMDSVMHHSVIVDDKNISVKDDPQTWFNNLPSEFSGSRFRAQIK